MASSLAAARPLSRVRAVPVWLGRRMVAPWIFVDELIYSELAKSFAAHGHFLLRGEPAGASYGFVYPVLIAPAWRIFASVPQAYAAAKVIDSVAMSLAAVPAYFLARRVLSQPYALAAALLSPPPPAHAGPEHDVGRVADAYVEALERAAGGEAVRDSVYREVAGAAAAVGIEETAELSTALREVGLGE